MYTLRFHPKALEEYMQAATWYEAQQVLLGSKFEEVIGRKLQQIFRSPETYRFIKSPYRQAVVKVFPFCIVYKINKPQKEIYISAIFHTKRRPAAKFRRDK